MGWTACARRMVSGPISDRRIPTGIPGLDQLADRADRVLDRDVGIEAAQAIDVDVIDTEPLETVAEEVLDGDRW